ncbi:hypothetical protein LDVICp108 [lymphocystis disease virus-China]|uniref:Uncharacterized protein n=1 Tax=lymphocystis disease virus-China TaxID=256729 RepID=Q678A4_9VIRU|nr:hypothetical protein LDVICp108 [lymphocystis disease virus-China]AAU10953.1 hypothetical protein [lymphocystis disease virus-China]
MLMCCWYMKDIYPLTPKLYTHSLHLFVYSLGVKEFKKFETLLIKKLYKDY